MTLKVCESTVESAALEWFGANKGDVLDCFGKMPSLRRAGLPGSFSLPKQLRMFLTVTDFGGDAVFAGFHEAPRFRCRSRNSLWPSKLSAPIFRQPTSVQQSLLPFPRP